MRGVSFTVTCTTNQKGIILETSPIFRRFHGCHVDSFIAWLKPNKHEKWKCQPFHLNGESYSSKLIKNSKTNRVDNVLNQAPKRKGILDMVTRRSKKAKARTPDDLDWSVLDIDEDDIVAEWMRQPRLVGKFIKEQAEAKDAHERAKSKFELVKAELDLAMRIDPESYDLPKVTESVIESARVTQDEYKEAHEAVINGKYRVDLIQGVVSGLDHKKRALEKIVDMIGMEFYAPPKAKGAGKEAMEDLEISSGLQSGRTKKRTLKKRRRNDY